MTTKYTYHTGGREQHYKGKTGDCVVRSIAIATNKEYKEVWKELLNIAQQNGYMPNQEQVYAKYLSTQGWTEVRLGRNNDNLHNLQLPQNTWLILLQRSHMVAYKSKVVYDTWNSSKKRTYRYWIQK